MAKEWDLAQSIIERCIAEDGNAVQWLKMPLADLLRAGESARVVNDLRPPHVAGSRRRPPTSQSRRHPRSRPDTAGFVTNARVVLKAGIWSGPPGKSGPE